MTVMRGWGLAAAGVAAVGVLVAGCGGGSGDDGKAAAGSSRSAVDSSPPASADPSPTYPPGAEGDVDRAVDEAGLVYDDSSYDDAAAFVQDICDSMTEQAKNWNPPQWLAEGGYLEDDGEQILDVGVPKLCPRWKGALKQAEAGTYVRFISSGDFKVKKDPAAFEQGADVEEIKPGTYVTVGRSEDCYWERTAADGQIVENRAVTQASRMTVTLKAGELFKNDCGTWKPTG
ncbi:hypothetical protein [Streptomyces sp. NPDC005548]|uniref:hypothetical protein n=1 Tax=Streptomyces sp. NPDC005548 TaxID=3364724 RepID=UPI0036A653E1